MRFFSPVVWLLVLSVTRPAWAESPSRCMQTCQKWFEQGHVSPPHCESCLRDPGDEGAWALRLPRVVAGMLDDSDWRVRWGALRLEARAHRVSAEQRLGSRITGSSGEARIASCVTAVHVAASTERTLASLLAPTVTRDPSVAPACVAASGDVRRALELEFLDVDERLARESLDAASAALGLSRERLMLDALATRPPEVDVTAAARLLEASLSAGAPVGRALLETATRKDEAVMNRLLKVYSRQRDAQRKALESGVVAQRIEAIQSLAGLAPLSEPELTQALFDVSSKVQLEAAQALAHGERRTLVQAAYARLDPAVTATFDEQLVWLHLVAETSGPACASLGLEAWANTQLAFEVRAAGLSTAVVCDAAVAQSEVVLALESHDVRVRAAALDAAAEGPSSERLTAFIARGLEADDALEHAAALHGVARHRLARFRSSVELSVSHAAPEVRARALEALAAVSPGLARAKAGELVTQPTEPEGVRVAAARALGQVGGLRAIQALVRASTDGTPAVRHAAAESLRRLGADGSVQP